MDLHLYKRRRFELVLKVIPRNRRFLICRDTVVTEKRVYIYTGAPPNIDKYLYTNTFIYIDVYAYMCLYIYSLIGAPRYLCGSSAALGLLVAPSSL